MTQTTQAEFKHWCETCEGLGTIDETLGGEFFSNPQAECPDCDGKGYWISRAALASQQEVAPVTDADVTKALLGMRFTATGLPKPEDMRRALEGFAASRVPVASVAEPVGVLSDIAKERARQDAKWGGSAHDDHHDTNDFVQLIEDYAGWARTMAGMNSPAKARNRLVQVAALAVAACESIDRKSTPATTQGPAADVRVEETIYEKSARWAWPDGRPDL